MARSLLEFTPLVNQACICWVLAQADVRAAEASEGARMRIHGELQAELWRALGCETGRGRAMATGERTKGSGAWSLGCESETGEESFL